MIFYSTVSINPWFLFESMQTQMTMSWILRTPKGQSTQSSFGSDVLVFNGLLMAFSSIDHCDGDQRVGRGRLVKPHGVEDQVQSVQVYDLRGLETMWPAINGP